MEIFQASLTQIITMFAFIMLGYILRKKDILAQNASNVLSSVLVWIFMPALIFANCVSNVTQEKLAIGGKLMLTGLAVLIAGYILAVVLSKLFSKDAYERCIYIYSFTVPNIGYMGSPLIEAVYGGEMLFAALMFVFPMYIFIYSKGMNMLNPNKKSGIKQVVLQPTILAIVLGVVVGLSSTKLPSVVGKFTSSASACVGPSAMILTGCVIAAKPLINLVNSAKVYIASILRLVVIPLTAMAIMMLLKLDDVIIISSVSMLAMPLGLNTVVFPEAYGGDGSKGAGMALVSHTLSIITIPVIFGLLSKVI